MKEFYFDEKSLTDLKEIGQQLFCDESDPRSQTYARVLIRPKINFWRIFASIFVPVLIFGLYFFVLKSLGKLSLPFVLAAVFALMLYVAAMLKSAVLCCVMLYQRYAPSAIRKKCRFEPSCSQYMILAIQKYGLIKGLFKGVNRLRRCNIHNGGYDMP